MSAIVGIFCLLLVASGLPQTSAASFRVPGALSAEDIRSAEGTRITVEIASGNTYVAHSSIPGVPAAFSNVSTLVTTWAAANEPMSHFNAALQDGRMTVTVNRRSATTSEVIFRCPSCYAYTDEKVWVMFGPGLFDRSTDDDLPRAFRFLVEREDTNYSFVRKVAVGVCSLLTLMITIAGSASHSALVHVSRLSILARSVECNQHLDFVLNPTQLSFGRGREGQFVAGLQLNFAIFLGIVVLHSVILRHFPKFFSSWFPGVTYHILIVLLPAIGLPAFETFIISDSPMRFALAILMFGAVAGLMALSFYLTRQTPDLTFSFQQGTWIHRLDPTFVARWQVLLMPFKTGNARMYLLLEILVTIAMCGFSATDPTDVAMDGCQLRSIGTSTLVGIELIALAAVRPYRFPAEMFCSGLFRVLELSVAIISIVGGVVSDSPTSAFVVIANTLIIAGAVIAMVKVAIALLITFSNSTNTRKVNRAGSYSVSDSLDNSSAPPTETRLNSGEPSPDTGAQPSPTGGRRVSFAAKLHQESQGSHDYTPPRVIAVPDESDTTSKPSPPQAPPDTSNFSPEEMEVINRIVRIMNYKHIDSMDLENLPTKAVLGELRSKFGPELGDEPAKEPNATVARRVLLSMRRRKAHLAAAVQVLQTRPDKPATEVLEEVRKEWGEPLASPPPESYVREEYARRVVRVMNHKYVKNLLDESGGEHQADEVDLMAAIEDRFGSVKPDVVVKRKVGDTLFSRLLNAVRMRAAHVDVVEGLLRETAPADLYNQITDEFFGGLEPPPTPMEAQLGLPTESLELIPRLDTVEFGSVRGDSRQAADFIEMEEKTPVEKGAEITAPPQAAVEDEMTPKPLKRGDSVFNPQGNSFVSPMRIPTRKSLSQRALQVPALTTSEDPGGEDSGKDESPAKSAGKPPAAFAAVDPLADVLDDPLELENYPDAYHLL